MEQTFGWLAILPPLIAIILAIATKEVLLSLLVGVFSGALVLSGYNPIDALMKTIEIIATKLGDAEWNIRVIVVVVLLGGLVGLLNKSGGSRAFAEWVASKISSRKGAQGATWIMGILVFFDDYFNSLTIGSVMRPVTDRFRISREKLAYILDSTAAPVCILAPISSWVAYVVSLIAGAYEAAGVEEPAFGVFLSTIPYNFYAWTAILMVGIIIFTKTEFGPMARAEKRTLTTGRTYDDSSSGTSDDDFKDMVISKHGKVYDLILPIITLFGATIFFMLQTGGYFNEGVTLSQAFNETDAASSLIYGTFLGILVAIVTYRLHNSVTITDSMEALVVGMKSMFFACCLLTMAWTIGGICEELKTGDFLATLLADSLPGEVIPLLIFGLACFTAFSTGASWGTFAIIIPITVPLALATGAHLPACIAAVLGGGVFGDHCSPLADTTILSSTGAACNHLDHVKTQLPYAVTVAASASIGFLLAGILHSFVIPFITTMVLFFGSLVILHKIWGGETEDVARTEENMQPLMEAVQE
ncbi:Na+/H+ antiporter NhaC family protein [Desulforhopalus singaporensis]|uniref:Na+/H+ antiporter NhaC n=1 Tax=Desulforhopalus singaporensis TaxID=91360 RepID=A0A1H0TCI6_9BACT|nr:Na+/H+ antiporter NhaC family protein [Desulforhopalus singaporensis]SDP51719.1 Na+/H+ antiporter NhaC [Desulforhopalus singaporensis]